MTGKTDLVLDALRPWLDGTRFRKVLLAVSGGPDSTALMHAAAALASTTPLHVATVDHGLRPESAIEAEEVARMAAGLGQTHTILRWSGDKPNTGLQDAARDARYALLAAHAAACGADLLLTAHTRDDQAETVLMRLAAGSGLAGLAGMRAERPLGPSLCLGRPFLGLDKATLVTWCEARSLPYVRDPSNSDVRFARARLRAAAAALAAEGLTSARLGRLAERAARDEDALQRLATDALEAALLPPRTNRLRLDGGKLAGLPDGIALRCLDLAFDRAGGTARRLERLEALVLGTLLPSLRRGDAVRRTLAGLMVTADVRGIVTLSPAPPRKTAGPAAPAPGLLGNEHPPAYIGEA